MNVDNILDICQKFDNIGEVCDYVIVNNLLCISCYVKTESPYFYVLGDGTVIYKDYHDSAYISSFNSSGYGNGLVIIDLNYFQIIKSFYFKDTLCWDYPISLGFNCYDYLIVGYQESSYVFYFNDFSFLEFGGFEYKVCEPYIINFPGTFYSKCNEFTILDTTTRQIVNLTRFLPVDKISQKPFKLGQDNVFISKDKLICLKVNEITIVEEEFSLPLNIIFGRNFTLLQDKGVSEREICDMRHINEIKPILGYSLGVYRAESYDKLERNSSYISQLLYLVKYQFRKDKIDELAHLIARYVKGLHICYEFDVIIPIPCSDKSRQFQPLYEIVKTLSRIVEIPYDFDYLLSKDKRPIKTIYDEHVRKKTLDEALYISDEKKYLGKKILLIDDHIYSGDTIKTSISKCKCEEIFVIAITRTEFVEYLP